MKSNSYRRLLLDYIDNQIDVLNKIRTLEIPDFFEETIDCSLISEEYFNKLSSKIESGGVTESTPILYYITFEADGTEKFLTEIGKRKSASKTGVRYLALPRINSKEIKKGVQTLYVGKTNRNFINRLKNHFGFSSTKTYSLQLRYWACNAKMNLRLYYAVMPEKAEFTQHLESLESVLHSHLKPLLGRAGH